MCELNISRKGTYSHIVINRDPLALSRRKSYLSLVEELWHLRK